MINVTELSKLCISTLFTISNGDVIYQLTSVSSRGSSLSEIAIKPLTGGKVKLLNIPNMNEKEFNKRKYKVFEADHLLNLLKSLAFTLEPKMDVVDLYEYSSIMNEVTNAHYLLNEKGIKRNNPDGTKIRLEQRINIYKQRIHNILTPVVVKK